MTAGSTVFDFLASLSGFAAAFPLSEGSLDLLLGLRSADFSRTELFLDLAYLSLLGYGLLGLDSMISDGERDGTGVAFGSTYGIVSLIYGTPSSSVALSSVATGG